MEKSIDLIFHLKLLEKFYNKYNCNFTIINNYVFNAELLKAFLKLVGHLAFLPLFCALRTTLILNKRNTQNRNCFFFFKLELLKLVSVLLVCSYSEYLNTLYKLITTKCSRIEKHERVIRSSVL